MDPSGPSLATDGFWAVPMDGASPSGSQVPGPGLPFGACRVTSEPQLGTPGGLGPDAACLGLDLGGSYDHKEVPTCQWVRTPTSPEPRVEWPRPLELCAHPGLCPRCWPGGGVGSGPFWPWGAPEGDGEKQT